MDLNVDFTTRWFLSCILFLVSSIIIDIYHNKMCTREIAFGVDKGDRIFYKRNETIHEPTEVPARQNSSGSLYPLHARPDLSPKNLDQSTQPFVTFSLPFAERFSRERPTSTPSCEIPLAFTRLSSRYERTGGVTRVARQVGQVNFGPTSWRLSMPTMSSKTTFADDDIFVLSSDT